MTALSFAFALAACAHSSEPVRETTTTSANWDTNEDGKGYPGTTSPSASAQWSDPGTVTFPRPRAGAQPATGKANGNATMPAQPPVSYTVPNAGPGAETSEKPDNTGVNERDRGNTATPLKQGNSKQELGITAAIRREVVTSKALGFTAKNVKIITIGTKVTLRGPVDTAQERDVIEAHARQAAGVTEVDNQIEVKK